MVLSWAISGFLVLLTVIIHYEALRLLDWAVRKLARLYRLRIVFVVLGCFFAHLVEVVVFAVGLYLSATWLELGQIKGTVGEGFGDYLHLSIVSYTSLGLGDIYATGDLRPLIGVEALIGLMMITWSATFTFLEMRRIWEDREGPRF